MYDHKINNITQYIGKYYTQNFLKNKIHISVHLQCKISAFLLTMYLDSETE